MRQELSELVLETKTLMKELRSHVDARKAISADYKRVCRQGRTPYLLKIAEGLIDAHRAAKIDDDGLTMDLIEDALRHVGKRLAVENGDARDFDRRGVAPER